MHGQRAGRAEDALGDLGHRAGGVDQRSGLAHDAARGQDNARQDAGHGAGQYDGKHGAQLARTQAEAALAVGVRHGDERFLGGAHDDGQHHNGQREGTGDQRVAPVQLGDEEQHAEQAVHDGRDALQGLGGQADQTHQLAAAVGVLHQPDGGKDAQRRSNDQREGGHQQRIDEGGHQRNILAVIFPGEEGGFEVGDAVDQDVSDEEQQHSGGQGSSQPHQAAQQGGLHACGGAVAAPVGVDGFGGGTAHVRHSSAVVGNGIRHGPCLLSKR